MSTMPSNAERTDDPLLVTARREALIVAAAFVLALLYTVTYCTRYGYDRPAESITFVLGFPDWVFYGILCPWAVCTVLACAFSYFLMQDHELADDVREDDVALAEQEIDGE
jgi:hypothetical protein